MPTRGASALRVLLIDADAARGQAVRVGLEAQGLQVVALTTDIIGLTERVRQSGADVIVCGIDDPSRDALDSMRALQRDEPRPVVLFTESAAPEQIEAAIDAGVAAYVAEGLAPERVRPVIEVAIRQFRAYQALREQLLRTQTQLEERKLIERAKGLLMQARGLSEDEAHQALRRAAMDEGIRLVEAAQRLLAQNINKKRMF
ncbi:ANTAR domain-containing response regulator [Roseomonas elaeocarpi]|uniref:ANTAR domain-containing response regulator n=1 Tax=Roseomonas elaeocarpi TaxID=907779 RepID=A0ABV6JN77_9PROT